MSEYNPYLQPKKVNPYENAIKTPAQRKAYHKRLMEYFYGTSEL